MNNEWRMLAPYDLILDIGLFPRHCHTGEITAKSDFTPVRCCPPTGQAAQENFLSSLSAITDCSTTYS